MGDHGSKVGGAIELHGAQAVVVGLQDAIDATAGGVLLVAILGAPRIGRLSPGRGKRGREAGGSAGRGVQPRWGRPAGLGSPTLFSGGGFRGHALGEKGSNLLLAPLSGPAGTGPLRALAASLREP